MIRKLIGYPPIVLLVGIGSLAISIFVFKNNQGHSAQEALAFHQQGQMHDLLDTLIAPYQYKASLSAKQIGNQRRVFASVLVNESYLTKNNIDFYELKEKIDDAVSASLGIDVFNGDGMYVERANFSSLSAMLNNVSMFWWVLATSVAGYSVYLIYYGIRFNLAKKRLNHQASIQPEHFAEALQKWAES